MASTALQLDFNKLAPYQPRSFVPLAADLRDKGQVTALYRALIDRSVTSSQALERWLLDRSELESVLQQAGDVLYIKMTCQTDDPVHSDAYKQFIEEIVPAVKPLEDELNRRYLTYREKWSLPASLYGVYDRALRADVELFREANVPLSTEVQLLSQEYQTVCGAMTVQFQGEERTLPQMSKYLLEPDRSLRESAWRATAERRSRDRDKMDDLFEKMLALRHRIALNAGFAHYRDYQFKAYHRFDYTPADCREYHSTVARLVVPLCGRIQERRRQQMGLASLRPWDTEVDPFGRPALKPFSEVDELIRKTGDIFARVHPVLGQQFGEMAGSGLLDLASRKGKAPGGYQSTLTETRKPFIFMNAVGVDQDMRTLLHEGGHAFHAYASAGHSLREYRHAPMEFCEVASMSMELLGDEYLDLFYSPEDAQRSKIMHFEDVIQILAWVATVDAFQHWIYENPGHSRAERHQKWVELYTEFGGQYLDWSGLEDLRAVLWHRQLHIFEVPFYYIEYGIAQLGAMQLWLNAKKDLPGAVEAYRRGLALGGSRPLPELFSAAGIRFDFSEKTIAPLVAAAARELDLK